MIIFFWGGGLIHATLATNHTHKSKFDKVYLNMMNISRALLVNFSRIRQWPSRAKWNCEASEKKPFQPAWTSLQS